MSNSGARARWAATLLVAVVTTAVVGPGQTAVAGTTAPGAADCPMFPADNVWNAPINSLPVDPHSGAWMASLGSSGTFLHPDFGPSGDPSNPYGIPFTVVPAGHPFVNVLFQYADESDPGPYPFGPDTPIEGGQNATGDRHAIMVDPSTCTLYELYNAQYDPNGSTAGSGAIWNLRSDALRPAGWTSADAAGLPILPGLADYDEAASGSMDHAIRFTAQCTENSFIWPARHQAGQADPSCPPMGARFRLSKSFGLPASLCDAICQTVIATLQDYGLILADNGSNWYFQGTADTRWTESDVDEMKQIPADQFVAVDGSSLMVDPGSGQAASSGSGPSAPAPTTPTTAVRTTVPLAATTTVPVTSITSTVSGARPSPRAHSRRSGLRSAGVHHRHGNAGDGILAWFLATAGATVAVGAGVVGWTLRRRGRARSA